MSRLAMFLTALVTVTGIMAVPAADAASVPPLGGHRRAVDPSPELGDRWLFEPCGIVSACVVYDGQGICRQAEQVRAHRPGGDAYARECVEPNGGGTVMVQWGCPADTLRQTRIPTLGTTCSIAWYFGTGQGRRKPTGKA